MSDRTEAAIQCQANDSGHTLYLWPQGLEVWTCCAYDHGPFCRLCHKVEDEVELALIKHVFDGNMQVRCNPDGEYQFKVTEQGQARVEDLLISSDDARKLWDDFHIGEFERQFDDPDDEPENGSSDASDPS